MPIPESRLQSLGQVHFDTVWAALLFSAVDYVLIRRNFEFRDHERLLVLPQYLRQVIVRGYRDDETVGQVELLKLIV